MPGKTSLAIFAATTLGSKNFGIEIFCPQTANVLMTLQLIFDIKTCQPQVRGEESFIQGANHGGCWHLGYCFRSVMVPSLVVGLLQKLLAGVTCGARVHALTV